MNDFKKESVGPGPAMKFTFKLGSGFLVLISRNCSRHVIFDIPGLAAAVIH